MSRWHSDDWLNEFFGGRRKTPAGVAGATERLVRICAIYEAALRSIAKETELEAGYDARLARRALREASEVPK